MYRHVCIQPLIPTCWTHISIFTLHMLAVSARAWFLKIIDLWFLTLCFPTLGGIYMRSICTNFKWSNKYYFFILLSPASELFELCFLDVLLQLHNTTTTYYINRPCTSSKQTDTMTAKRSKINVNFEKYKTPKHPWMLIHICTVQRIWIGLYVAYNTVYSNYSKWDLQILNRTTCIAYNLYVVNGSYIYSIVPSVHMPCSWIYNTVCSCSAANLVRIK